MIFPDYRPRRLRQNDAFRRIIRVLRTSEVARLRESEKEVIFY